ncbi:MAG: DUF1343 domain-containing protein [Melioribacteraceae bacterium]|nr:MAG: DUF1343 domain-containing protein [Melioribacteraceae bacterium]
MINNRFLNYAAIFFAAFSFLYAQKIKLGNDVLLTEHLDLIKGKRIGVVTNTAATLSSGERFIDALLDLDGITIQSVFALEHGFELQKGAGVVIPNSTIEQIKIHSLYGSNKKPTPQMMADLDIIIFDIQDIGTRFYTYISSLLYLLEACGENNVDIIVLDRPNPLGGILVDGPILEDNFKSFVGVDNIPVIHGMTIGELALFFNDRIAPKADLKVIKMQNWDRSKFWDELELPWRDPSPNIVNFESVLLYPITVFFEGTNISEGRGTYTPFHIFGAPFIDSKKLKDELTPILSGDFILRAIEFVPVSIEDKASNPKYKNEICEGIQLKLVSRENYNPLKTALTLLTTLQQLYGDNFEFTSHFDLLWGNAKIKDFINSNKSVNEIIDSWGKDLAEFKEIRKNYLLY